jgi:FkbM family methyltransferase
VRSVITGAAGAVHAFEPVRHICHKLKSNVAINGGRNVIVNDFALGAEPDELKMFQVKEGVFRGGTTTVLCNNMSRRWARTSSTASW